MSTPTPTSNLTSGLSADATAPFLQLRGITASYGKNKPVLNGLSMNIRAGEVYGLLGLNGAGKSTLMSTVPGLVPYSGEISTARYPWPAVGLDRIGVSINGPAFYPWLSVIDNLKVHAHLTGTDKSRITEALGLVELHAGNKRARAFSTGMKVRLPLTMALSIGPDIMFLDEPTNGLNSGAIVGLRTLLRSLTASDKAVVVSSYQLGEVEKSVDHLGVPTGGRLVYEGLLTDFAASGQPLEQAFFIVVGVVR